jgi:hypothetical protein
MDDEFLGALLPDCAAEFVAADELPDEAPAGLKGFSNFAFSSLKTPPGGTFRWEACPDKIWLVHKGFCLIFGGCDEKVDEEDDFKLNLL